MASSIRKNSNKLKGKVTFPFSLLLYYGKQHKEKQQQTKRKSNLNVGKRSQLVPSDKNTTEQCPDPETTPTRAQTQNKTKPRFDFLDNIKTVLTVVVLLFHLSGGFGASAGVVLKIGDFSNTWSKYWSSFFIGPCSFFFMSLFFFISAYFVPRSLAKKGRVVFIKERAQRILFGAIIATFIFTPVAIIWAIVVAAPSWGTTFSDVHWQYQPIAGTTWFLWWLFFFNIWYAFTASKDNNYRLPLSKYFKSFPSSFVYRCLVGIFICGYLQFCATVYLFADASNFAFMPVDAGNDFICYLLFFYVGLLAGKNRWFEHEKKYSRTAWYECVAPSRHCFDSICFRFRANRWSWNNTWLTNVTRRFLCYGVRSLWCSGHVCN